MDNFLKKLGFVDYLEMEFPMSKDTLLKKLKSKVDYGSDDFGVRYSFFPQKKYLAIINNSSIQLDRKPLPFYYYGASGRSKGKIIEKDGKSIINFRIAIKAFPTMKALILITTLLFGLTISLNTNLAIFTLVMIIYYYSKFKDAIAITKKNLKIDLVKMLSEE